MMRAAWLALLLTSCASQNAPGPCYAGASVAHTRGHNTSARAINDSSTLTVTAECQL